MVNRFAVAVVLAISAISASVAHADPTAPASADDEARLTDAVVAPPCSARAAALVIKRGLAAAVDAVEDAADEIVTAQLDAVHRFRRTDDDRAREVSMAPRVTLLAPRVSKHAVGLTLSGKF